MDKEKIKKAAARAFDLEEGKTVVVALTIGGSIRVDYRCMDKDTDVCDKCGLRFKCYSCQYLTITMSELYPHGLDVNETINEKAKRYVESFKEKDEKSTS